ncbi:hypothetical protein [Nostoc sp. NMS8]|uniref:hypothetical protein n=1 Tax=Nostoc sp. NMS8 TaxID=2815392 RepID=UPI0025F351DA|nr:hypothetical protein [Nostoc sp. NMS8]
MLKPVCYKTNEHRSYLQALDDFGITELLAKLSDYGEQQEQETLAAVLIYQLTQSINAELIANYSSAIAKNHQDLFPEFINQKLFVDLPEDFPDTAKTPRFLYGDRLRWLSSDTDWGIVIGKLLQLCSPSLLLELVLPNFVKQRQPQCSLDICRYCLGGGLRTTGRRAII